MSNRGLALAFTSSPYIISAFGGPKAAEGFYEDISWRWSFGAFCIILPVVALPLYIVMHMNQVKAAKSGLLDREPSGRTMAQSIWHYIIEFDVVGVFLLAAGLVLFLLPFSLAEGASDKWKSGHIIAMLVVGIVCLIAFALAEAFVAPKPFIPFHLLLSRNVMGACLLDATYQVAYYCWNSYFTSYLQVVHGVSMSSAGYITSIFDVVSGVWLFATGFLIRYTGYYKWLLLVAVPLYIFFVGLLIYFRQPDTKLGYVIMCQIFIAFAGSTMIIGQQIAVMAVAEHGQIAALLAILGLFGYMGGAVGNTISGAIWTNALPKALEDLLPKSANIDISSLIGDIEKQLEHPKGHPVRDAIIAAYGIAQRRMLIAGTAIMALALIWVLLLKNIKVSDVKQVKGMLF